LDWALIVSPVLGALACYFSLVLSWKRTKLRRFVITAWLLVAILGCFFPAMMTMIWHAKHGNSVRLGARTIPVPLRWTADVSSEWVLQGVTLTKPPISVFQSDSPRAYIFLSPQRSRHNETRDDITKTWVSLNWMALAGNDKIVSGPFELGSAPTGPLCMDSVDRRSPDQASASCLLAEATWRATFSGSDSGLQEFFQIVRSIK
jgi:hypothetical protein